MRRLPSAQLRTAVLALILGFISAYAAPDLLAVVRSEDPVEARTRGKEKPNRKEKELEVVPGQVPG